MDWVKRNFDWMISILSLVVAVASLAFVATRPAPQVIVPAITVQQPNTPIIINDTPKDSAPPDYSMGWRGHNDPELVTEAGAGSLHFADTPAGKAVLEGDVTDVFLWDYYVKLTGNLPPVFNQGDVGSCTGHGNARAIERTMAYEIANKLVNADFQFVSEEYLYGYSRHQIGNDQIRGDGSMGGWVSKAALQGGTAYKMQFAGFDLTKYSTTLCRQWGKTGPPNDVVTEAKKYIVKSSSLVNSWELAKKSLAQGYGIGVCSSQGFGNRRDSNGVAQAQGTWAHCMCLDGFHREPNGDEYGHIENSWGTTWISGPVGWGNPSLGGFWAKSAVIDRMLKSGDSYNYSGVPGFPKRKVNWFVKVETNPGVCLMPGNDMFAFHTQEKETPCFAASIAH